METYQIVALCVSVALLLFVINAIRKTKLQEKYALLWILSAFTFIVFSIWFEAIAFLSELVGIQDPSHLLILTGGMYLIILNLHFSFTLSKLTQNQYKIIQHLSLLEEELRESKHKEPSNPSEK